MAIGRVNAPVGDYFEGDKVSKNNIRARYRKPVILNITNNKNEHLQGGGVDISKDGWFLYSGEGSKYVEVFDEKRERVALITTDYIKGAFFDDNNNIFVFTDTAYTPQRVEKYNSTGRKLWEVELKDHSVGMSQIIVHGNNLYINSILNGFYKITSSGSKSRITRDKVGHFDIQNDGRIATVSDKKIQIRSSSGAVQKEKAMDSNGAIIYDNTLNEYTFWAASDRWGDKDKIYRLDSNLNTINSKTPPKMGSAEWVFKNRQDEMVGYNQFENKIIQFDSNNDIQFEVEFDTGTNERLHQIQPGPNNSCILNFYDGSLAGDQGRALLVHPGNVYEYEIVKGV